MSFLDPGFLFSAQHLLCKVRDALGRALAPHDLDLYARRWSSHVGSEQRKGQSAGFNPWGGASPDVLMSPEAYGSHIVISESSLIER